MEGAFEVFRLTSLSVGDRGPDGVAARYLALMNRLTKNMPDTATVDDMIRYIKGSVESGFWVFGCFLGGVLVSVASVHTISHAWAKIAWIEDVVTFPEHEGHRYSTRVLEHAEAFVREHFPASLGLERVSRQMLTCSTVNQPFYRNRGFVLRNEVVMQKDM